VWLAQAAAGIVFGMQIVAVNGEPTATREELVSIFGQSGKEVTITVVESRLPPNRRLLLAQGERHVHAAAGLWPPLDPTTRGQADGGGSVTVVASHDCRGGGAGREFAANVLSSSQAHGMKWYTGPTYTETFTLIVKLSSTSRAINGVGFQSANGVADRDPDQVEIFYRNPFHPPLPSGGAPLCGWLSAAASTTKLK
jgi:membrane-associated protease RseP (regulator of RpoE activity)